MPSALTCVSAHATARASAFLTGADRARGRATGATPRGPSTKNRSAAGTSRFEPWRRDPGSRRVGRSASRFGTSARAALGPTVRLLKFDPKRCSVFFLDTHRSAPEPGRERRYTLTHNDVTRHLTMSVAPDFNGGQTAVWITRVLRDEVLAEWKEDGLHVHCFVSVENHWWLDWASALRSTVFRQKLPLVLDFLRYAERELLAQKPGLLDAPVFVHFHEDRGEALKAGERVRRVGRRREHEKRALGAAGDGGDGRRDRRRRGRRRFRARGILGPRQTAAAKAETRRTF